MYIQPPSSWATAGVASQRAKQPRDDTHDTNRLAHIVHAQRTLLAAAAVAAAAATLVPLYCITYAPQLAQNSPPPAVKQASALDLRCLQPVATWVLLPQWQALTR